MMLLADFGMYRSTENSIVNGLGVVPSGQWNDAATDFVYQN